jgi:hypothetical protein
MALGKETLAIGLVDMMERLIGALSVLGVHALVHVPYDFLVTLQEVDVLARFIIPGVAVMLGMQGKKWGREKKSYE